MRRPPPEDALDAAPSDPETVARLICLRLLTGAPRTRAQLADALSKRGVPDDAAGRVLDRFSAVGLVDDRAFAAAWVSSRHTGRGLASRALRHELQHRGVDPDTTAQAVSVLDADTERETARRLVRSRLARMTALDPDVAARRLAGLLARKGYSAGMAFAVVREELTARSDADLRPPADEFGRLEPEHG